MRKFISLSRSVTSNVYYGPADQSCLAKSITLISVHSEVSYSWSDMRINQINLHGTYWVSSVSIVYWKKDDRVTQYLPSAFIVEPRSTASKADKWVFIHDFFGRFYTSKSFKSLRSSEFTSFYARTSSQSTKLELILLKQLSSKDNNWRFATEGSSLT